MGKASWKCGSINKSLLKKIILKKSTNKVSGKQQIIFNKSFYIPSIFQGEYFKIYKGNVFRRIKISSMMVGVPFGVFIHTRKPFKYVIKNKT